MKVTPTRLISGLIDGVQWVAPGDVMDVSDDSAAILIEAGDVEAVEDEAPADAPKRRGRKAVETAAAPVVEVETAAVED